MRSVFVLFASLAMAQTVPAPAPVASPVAPPVVPAAAAASPRMADLMRAAVEKQRAAMAIQQEAIRKQAQDAGATMLPWDPAPGTEPPTASAAAPAATCDPLAAEVVTPLIELAAKANTLDVKLVKAVVAQESGFRPCAVSAKGARGLMQLMPDTAGLLNVKDAFDPQENIAAGARYLRQLLDKYKGNNRLALAAYNAGVAAVDAANGVPDIAETRDYVDAILKKIK